MKGAEGQFIASLLGAYREGYFPMASPARGGQPGPLRWYNPDPRGVIPLERFHASRSLRRRVRSGRFEVTSDRAFEDVMRGCAEPRPFEPDTWIDDRLVRLYTGVHEAGNAHSIEAWLEGKLVGGLYGVHLGAAFFAESKFSRPGDGGTDASKVCLVHLVYHLRRRGFVLLDVQFSNLHLEQFGVEEIPRRTYLEQLELAVARPVSWEPFEPERTRAELTG